MNLLAIIIILLALVTAGAVIYAAWELSSDREAAPRPVKPESAEAEDGESQDNAPIDP